MPTCSAGWVGAGSEDKNCQSTSGPQSTGICASSTGWAKISKLFDQEIAARVIGDPSVKRLLTITGVNINVAAGLVAAIGDIRRFSSPQKLVSYVGLNPRVRQSGLGLAQHGRISKRGRSHARAMLVEGGGGSASPRHQARCARSFYVSELGAATRSQRSPWHASSPYSAGIC